MQEALRQGCRRSARLLQRASAASAQGMSPSVARALHHEPGNTQEATGTSKGRRRRAPTSRQANATEDAQQQQQSTGAAALQALGSITNRSDVLSSLTKAATEAAAAADVHNPPHKRQRRRQPRAATTAATAPAAAAAESAACSAEEDGTAPAAADTAEPTAAPGAAAVNAMKAAAPQASKGRSKGSSQAASGPSRAAEKRLWARGYQAVAGIDEAGRGPLAGPVVAAAAVLPPDVEFDLLNDSKQMTEANREAVFEQLTTHPGVSYAITMLGPEDIDKVNILQATMIAMRAAVSTLEGAGLKPDYLLVDGNRKPGGADDTPQEVVVKGDASITCIAAASVLAKVSRDRLMVELDKQHPQYGLAQHKGYGTAAHRAAIQQHGPCPAHRRSFEPVKSMTKWPGYPGGAPEATIIAVKASGKSVGAAIA